MATVEDIINAAGRKIGLSSLDTDDINNALEALNNMLGMLGIEFITPYSVKETLALTAGDAEYTVGSTGDLNTVRPLALNNIFLRDADGYDYPVGVINNVEYNDITIKTAEGRPTKVYYIPEYPLVRLVFNYEPDTTYTAYFDFQKGFTEYAAVSETVTLPNEYKKALIYNLAVDMAEDFDIQPSQSVLETAKYSRLLISRLRAINSPPPRVRFDFLGNGTLDIETDT